MGLTGTRFVDYGVKVGRTYYYVVTAFNNVESDYSNEAVVTVR